MPSAGCRTLETLRHWWSLKILTPLNSDKAVVYRGKFSSQDEMDDISSIPTPNLMPSGIQDRKTCQPDGFVVVRIRFHS
jgi:hypothetical protein